MPPRKAAPTSDAPPVARKPMSSTMAAARASLQKANINEADWRVTLDPDKLTKSLPHLPTGSFVIDYLIGGEPNKRGVSPCPGLPKGRISQLWGHESSGKTTLALTTAATTCARGGNVLYIDFENDIVPDYAEALGVPITDPDQFELAQPNTLEEGFKIMMAYAQAGVSLICIDSVGAAVPQKLFERTIEEMGDVVRMGLVAQKWSEFLPQLKAAINRSGTSVLGISQIRAKLATGPAAAYGPQSEPQGGNAWRFYSAIRMELKRIKQEKTKVRNVLLNKVDDRVTGGVIIAKMIKCKLSKSQGREEVFYIRWGEGIDDARSIIEVASAHNIVKKGGAWYTWTKPDGSTLKVAGVDKLRAEMLADPVMFETLCSSVRPFLTSGAHTATAFSDSEEFEAVDDPAMTEIDSYLDPNPLAEGEEEPDRS